MLTEKEERKEEAKHEESKLDRERRHKEQLKVQSSLVSILQQFLNQKYFFLYSVSVILII